MVKRKADISSIDDKKRIESLCLRAESYIEYARSRVQKSIDIEMVKAYWEIGREIIEEEQYGQQRARYGKSILKILSKKLQKRYGRGFSVDVLEKSRKFFLIYQVSKGGKKSATLSRKFSPVLIPHLSWSHYIELMKVSREEARNFYAIEASKNHWNVRELRRQISSFLFDRFLKSKDKKSLLKISCKGQEIIDPSDAIKDPIVLEFLGIPESHGYSESQLEAALINNLQHFLLELGRGFAFIARQKRITLDNNHYYADLVFYHVVLKCYVIIDIKRQPVNHGDLGQMQLYVNYFDKEVKMENDNPTIGLILCTDTNDAMVQYTLGEKGKQIFASKYQFHLPTEKELELELKREIKAIRHQVIG